jgi:hypothetical protein
MVSEEDACRELNLPPSATRDEVEQAFRERARYIHPDVSGGSSAAFRRAKDARDALLQSGPSASLSSSARSQRSPFGSRSSYDAYDTYAAAEEEPSDSERKQQVRTLLVCCNDRMMNVSERFICSLCIAGGGILARYEARCTGARAEAATGEGASGAEILGAQGGGCDRARFAADRSCSGAGYCCSAWANGEHAEAKRQRERVTMIATWCRTTVE